MQLEHAASRPYILRQVLYRGVSVVLRPVAELTREQLVAVQCCVDVGRSQKALESRGLRAGNGRTHRSFGGIDSRDARF